MSYRDRDLLLRRLGFSSYREYLRSAMWRRIKRGLLPASCSLCGSRASTLHHYRYTRGNLLGETTEHLYPICRACHREVEFWPEGGKRRMRDAQRVFDHLKKNFELPVKYQIPARATFNQLCELVNSWAKPWKKPSKIAVRLWAIKHQYPT